MKLNRKTLRIVITLIGMALAYFASHEYNKPSHDGQKNGHTQSSVGESNVATNSSHSDESARLVEAHAKRQSKVWMTVKVKVVKRLRDDNQGHRHQRFLAKPTQGPTLKIAHNIDLAPYVPLKEGDTVWIRGRYEWNAKGGVLHWTHHDPKKPNRQDPKEGWIELNGKRYD